MTLIWNDKDLSQSVGVTNNVQQQKSTKPTQLTANTNE